jgi:hypothetical protein
MIFIIWVGGNMISDWIVCLHEEEFLFRQLRTNSFMRIRCCYIKKEDDEFVATINFRERVTFHSTKVKELVSLVDTYLTQKGFEVIPCRLGHFSRKQLPEKDTWIFIQNNIRRKYYE